MEEAIRPREILIIRQVQSETTDIFHEEIFMRCPDGQVVEEAMRKIHDHYKQDCDFEDLSIKETPLLLTFRNIHTAKLIKFLTGG